MLEPLTQRDSFVTQLKMPHSNFKERSHELNAGVEKCPCGQTFNFSSERDMNIKHQMHHKFCSKPRKSFKQVRKPNKATMLREQQLNEAEKIWKVHVVISIPVG